MSRRRFYAPAAKFPDATANRSIVLPIYETRHLRDTLRIAAGDEVFIFDGEGHEFRCRVEDTGRRQSSALLSVKEIVEPARAESPLYLTLGAALLKGEKFDLVVEKSTELGVRQIIPLITERCDVKLPKAHGAPNDENSSRCLRWRRLAIEACKQSGRARIPQIEKPMAFSSVVTLQSESVPQLRIMFTERAGESLSRKILNDQTQQPLLALTGPEGGWSDAEIDLARNAGFQLITLGGRILRAETASIVATALLQHLFGDLV